jgi:hypothetical protein
MEPYGTMYSHQRPSDCATISSHDLAYTNQNIIQIASVYALMFATDKMILVMTHMKKTKLTILVKSRSVFPTSGFQETSMRNYVRHVKNMRNFHVRAPTILF